MWDAIALFHHIPKMQTLDLLVCLSTNVILSHLQTNP